MNDLIGYEDDAWEVVINTIINRASGRVLAPIAWMVSSGFLDLLHCH
jgi:hypothetical protein